MEVPERPGIFVVGDAAALSQDGRPLPARRSGGEFNRAVMSGSSSVPGSRVARLESIRFRHFDKGNMAIVGRNFALLESRRLRTSGYLTWLIWGTIHLLFLPQLQSRLRVAGQWLWWSLTDQRSSLLLPETRHDSDSSPTKGAAH